jgi:hypothetical protein
VVPAESQATAGSVLSAMNGISYFAPVVPCVASSDTNNLQKSGAYLLTLTLWPHLGRILGEIVKRHDGTRTPGARGGKDKWSCAVAEQ